MPASLVLENPPRSLQKTDAQRPFFIGKRIGSFQQSLEKGNRETEAHGTDTQQHWAGTVFLKVKHVQAIWDTACPLSPAPTPPVSQGNKYSPGYYMQRPTASPGRHSSVFTLCIKSFWSIFSRS